MSLQPQTMTWQETAARLQNHRDDTIARLDPPVPAIPEALPKNVTHLHAQLLSPEVIAITETLPETLLQDLASGKISSTTVTKAFLQRAGLAGKLTNCVTELLPERALQRAKFLDDYLATKKKPIGPLHGLPISVKEHVSMQGLDLNAGFAAWVGTISPGSAMILQYLWTAGAIFHARTTQPQSLMHLETSSNLYGATTNPYNTALTSGGSSGGEGSLIGQRGSCLGVGTDIGGSIRSPAANNGVYGLRATSARIPMPGCAAAMLGAEHIIPVIGPISTSLEGLKIFTKAILDQKPWVRDLSAVVPIPWKEAKDAPGGTLLCRDAVTGRRKLRIGIMEHDGVVKPHPPILRGLKTLTTALSSHPDIELVPFPPYRHDEAWRIISSLYYADGGAEEHEALDASGEPMRPLTEWIMSQNVKDQGVKGVWELTLEREGYRALYAQHWQSVGTSFPGPLKVDSPAQTVGEVGYGGEFLDGTPLPSAEEIEGQCVDVLLCPVGPGCAPKLDTARYWGYTSQWNLLDYPAVAFPTGLQCSEIDKSEEGYIPISEADEYNYQLYDSPASFIDAPISLQLVGKRYEDEKLIEALEMITEIAGLPFSASHI